MQSKEELIQEIRDRVGSHGEVQKIDGIYGDGWGCGAYIKDVTYPGAGAFTELYGCSYKFPGEASKKHIDWIQVGKAMISGIPRFVVLKNFWFTFGVVMSFLTSRKKFIYSMKIYLANVHMHVFRYADYPKERYCKFVRELRKASWNAVAYMVKKEGLSAFEVNGRDLKLANYAFEVTSKRDLWELVYDISEFASLFLEFDNAYRFPLQDILSNLDKELLRVNPRKEIIRLADLALTRSQHTKAKFKFVRMGLRIMLLSRRLKEFFVRFLEELDLEQVKMTEADMYFNLNRHGYDFGGEPYEERKAKWDAINTLKGHCILGI